jgi:hypothetical protein
VVVGDIADPLFGGDGVPCYVVPVDFYASLVGAKDARNQLYSRGFSRPVRAKKAENLARLYLEA